jgi:hypothetical protein
MINTLLLTSCIYVNNCSYLQRSDPNDRLNDLKLSLKKWFENTSFNIILVDNSNIDINCLEEFITQYSSRFEILTFEGNNYPREYGKGYGERESINYALKHSKFLENKDYIMKCTGRYYLSNLEKVLNEIKDIEKYEAIAQESKVIPGVLLYCAFFYVKKDLFEKYINNTEINDSLNKYIEHAFEKMYSNISKEKISTVSYLGLEGISGTLNNTIDWIQ